METKWHRETIEALGMVAPRKRITNKLNAVYAHTTDPKLREMAKKLIDEIESANSNTASFPPKELKNGVPSASSVLTYCESIAFAESGE